MFILLVSLIIYQESLWMIDFGWNGNKNERNTDGLDEGMEVSFM